VQVFSTRISVTGT